MRTPGGLAPPGPAPPAIQPGADREVGHLGQHRGYNSRVDEPVFWSDPPAAQELRPIADLVRDPKNRRTHLERNREMIAASLRSVGAARSIVIDEADEVLAGNYVLEAAPAAGIERVRIIEAEGDELIAVRRRNLTPEQKRDLAIFDNRTGELSAWNLDQLRADQAAGLDLAPFFDGRIRKPAQVPARVGVGRHVGHRERAGRISGNDVHRHRRPGGGHPRGPRAGARRRALRGHRQRELERQRAGARVRGLWTA